ncbi:MAG: hypothetical protein ABSA52_12890 [Candidatus Binatia bacterium]|jgi:hypothetical protein
MALSPYLEDLGSQIPAIQVLHDLAVISADPPLKLLDRGHCDQTFAQPLQ